MRSLQPGDVVLEVNHDKVASVKDFLAKAKDAQTNKKPALLLVQRGGATLYMVIKPAGRKRKANRVVRRGVTERRAFLEFDSPRLFARCVRHIDAAFGMEASRKCDVLIAGAGPAGLATALYPARSIGRALTGRVVAIEKSAHPRSKVCAGGLIPKTMLALEELGLALDVPAVEVIRGEARDPGWRASICRATAMCSAP